LVDTTPNDDVDSFVEIEALALDRPGFVLRYAAPIREAPITTTRMMEAASLMRLRGS
jgi:hypothetical protein